MSKLSLQWRIALMMGILVFSSSILLTLFSIHNASVNFVTPLTQFSTSVYNGNGQDNGPSDPLILDEDASGLSGDIYYLPEVDFEPAYAKKIFSFSSVLCMALTTVVSIFAAYYLAGKAMRPITKLNHEIRLIDGNCLAKRVSVPPTNDELQMLSESFNRLLERLELEFERERQFSANVSHELKTPLATIITNAQVLKLSGQPSQRDYEENLDITLQNARRLSDVVNGLLLLYQTDREISMESVSLSSLFDEIQRELHPLYSEKNIEVHCRFETDSITGNTVLLYRALFNLIENAYKYTDKNGKITVTSQKENNDTVLYISDTGGGISSEDLAHIFEPFYRADKSRSRKTSGVGLGLSISKELLSLHHTEISIDSTLRKGTVLKIVFKENL